MPLKNDTRLPHHQRPTQRIANGSSFTKTAQYINKQMRRNPSALVRKKADELASDENAFKKYQKYRYKPAEFIEEILGITLTDKQHEICDALIEHRFLLCRSSHAVGKSYLLGALLAWGFYCWQPLAGIVTAPSKEHVEDVAFAYTRTFIEDAGLEEFFPGPAKPVMESRKNHYMKGLVTARAGAMQGRHMPNVIVAIDEAVEVDYDIHEALESLYIGDEVFVVMFYNPTEPDAHVATLEVQDDWYTIVISCEDHPNVLAGIEKLKNGQNPNKNLPFPGAMTLGRFEQLLKQWSTEITVDQYAEAIDVILPSSKVSEDPELYRYFRPGNIAESRLLGRWPTESSDNVFSEYLIDKARELSAFLDSNIMPTVGVDVARKGDDYSCIAIQVGRDIKTATLYSGQRNTQLAGRVMNIVNALGEELSIPPKKIPIAVDANGNGSGVVDVLWENNYNVIEVMVQEKSYEPRKYDSIRTQIWFELKEAFLSGEISLSLLPKTVFQSLRKQLLGPKYDYNGKGQKVLEPKKLTKKRIKRSPDTADAIGLANFANIASAGWSVSLEDESEDIDNWEDEEDIWEDWNIDEDIQV